MSGRRLTQYAGMRVALVALAAAIGVTAWTLVNAVRVEAIPDASSTSVASLQGIAPGTARPRAEISTVVDNDLFSADRSAPAEPYRMPGEADPNEKPAALPEKPLLLGTGVATDNRNFATVQLGAAGPTLVHVGDKIGLWVVKSIERGKIVLVTTGGAKVDVSVPKPGT
jgi:hypothetical protein